MTFEQEIWLTILDKGILAIILAVLAFALNFILQKRKSRDEFINSISSHRVSAYKKLWKISEPAKYAGVKILNEKKREEIFHSILDWYYEENGALFLSYQSSKALVEVKKALFDSEKKFENKEQEQTELIKDNFSNLRTCLKVDCGTYNLREKNLRLDTPEAPDPWKKNYQENKNANKANSADATNHAADFFIYATYT